jgi:hypothetical protein
MALELRTRRKTDPLSPALGSDAEITWTAHRLKHLLVVARFTQDEALRIVRKEAVEFPWRSRAG